MVVPVHSTIPDSTLSPGQVRQKFASLHGLGDACSDAGGSCTSYDEMGDCFICDYSSVTTLQIPGQGLTAPFGSGFTPPSDYSSGNVQVVREYVDASGDVVLVLSDGSYHTILQSGSTHSSASGTPPPPRSSGSSTVSAGQAGAWGALINSLSQAGVRLGTVAMLQPGQSLMPNGTIVGTNQSLIGPSGTGINIPSLSTLFSNPVFLIGGFGLIALIALSGGRR